MGAGRTQGTPDNLSHRTCRSPVQAKTKSHWVVNRLSPCGGLPIRLPPRIRCPDLRGAGWRGPIDNRPQLAKLPHIAAGQ